MTTAKQCKAMQSRAMQSKERELFFHKGLCFAAQKSPSSPTTTRLRASSPLLSLLFHFHPLQKNKKR